MHYFIYTNVLFLSSNIFRIQSFFFFFFEGEETDVFIALGKGMAQELLVGWLASSSRASGCQDGDGSADGGRVQIQVVLVL